MSTEQCWHEIEFTITCKRKCPAPTYPELRDEWLQEFQGEGLEPPNMNPYTTVTDLQIVSSKETDDKFYPSYVFRGAQGK